MHQYTPKAKPAATDLATIAQVRDELEEDKQESWASASRQPETLIDMTNEIGEFYAVEVDGDLHVHGDFNVAEHRIAALWVKGDLIVDGVYEDDNYPNAFVLIEGKLRAHHIITGAQLEVHGDVTVKHLVGDYNDFGARFYGLTKATTFFAERHSFEFLGGEDIALTLGDSPSPESLDLYVSAFVGDEFVDSYGQVRNAALTKALAQGKEILDADPLNLLSVKHISLIERSLDRLPNSLYSFVNLTSLILDDNNLTRLDGLEQLSKLEMLSVKGNPLESLPRALTGIRLRELDLGYWTDLPEWLSELEYLETLKLVVEDLNSMPPAVATLTSLTHLVLADFPIKSEELLDSVGTAIAQMNVERLSILCGGISLFSCDLAPFQGLKVLELLEQDLDEEERLRLVQGLPKVELRF